MIKRYRGIIGIGILLLVIIVAGVSYVAYSASRVNPPHTAPGAATACGTAIPSTGLSTFQIVPAQTTASYKVHENLVLRNLPNNDAIGRTHSVQGSFQVRTGSSPLVAAMKAVTMPTMATVLRATLERSKRGQERATR